LLEPKSILVFPAIIGFTLLGIGVVLIVATYLSHDTTDLAGAAVAIVGSHTPLSRSGIYERWQIK
jgi:hypothetical protein